MSTSLDRPMDSEGTLAQDQTAIDRALELSRHSDVAPAVVPGYCLVQSLGEGTFGSVWLAREENTGKQVAIKFYTHQRGLDWSLLSREVEKLAVLYTSRNIVRLIDVGWNSEPPYYVMEYLGGGSLSSILASGPLPVDEAVRIAKGVLIALVHAHGSGILHCDLKPANVLLDERFEPRLGDFGQSRLSNEQNPALGTLFYMAPEQADLHAIPDARWDVYALGALLYHMLCGKPPYQTEELEAEIRSAPNLAARLSVYRQRIGSSPKPAGLRKQPGVDRRLAEIVERCLNLDPQKRYPNAQAVLDMLELRERSRARRPLITLGIVGPSLLLMGMAWLVAGLLEAAGNDAGTLMTRRAAESDILSARIVAQGLKRDLDEREQELVEVAERISQDKSLEGLRTAIAGAPVHEEGKNHDVFADLESARDEADDRAHMMHAQKDFSWFVTDAHGIEKWRSPFLARSVGRNYAYQDYFHGQGESHHAGSFPQDIEPIKAPHISHRFHAQATGQNGPFLLAVSVPIWDVNHQKPIGVLGRTIEIESLLDEYGAAIFEDKPAAGIVNREIGLFETIHGAMLDHTWFDKNGALLQGHPLTVAQLEAVRLPDELCKKLQAINAPAGEQPRRDFLRDEHYIDPLSRFQLAAPDLGGEWLAALVSVPGTDWVTVVQERRSAALEPVQKMKARLRWNGFWALLASCGLIGLLWYFVGRALNDRPARLWPGRAAVAGNGHDRPTNGTGGGSTSRTPRST